MMRMKTGYIFRTKRLDEKEKHKLLDLAGHGISGAEIARLMDRSTSAVYRVLRECHVPVRPRDRTDALVQGGHAMVRHGEKTAPVEPETAEQSCTAILYFDCISCGDRWTMTESHMAWFVDRQLTPPRRCAPCRAARRGTHDYDKPIFGQYDEHKSVEFLFGSTNPGNLRESEEPADAFFSKDIEIMLRDIKRQLAETVIDVRNISRLVEAALDEWLAGPPADNDDDMGTGAM